MIEIEESSGNVYLDIGSPGANQMQVKARLADKIAEIIKARDLTQAQAAEILGISQPKLSGILRGQFRGVSEVKMFECLNRLGRDVEIIIGAATRKAGAGNTRVTFAGH